MYMTALPRPIWELGQTDLAFRIMGSRWILNPKNKNLCGDAGGAEDAEEVKVLTADD